MTKVRVESLAISLDGVDDRAALKPLFEKCEDYALTEKDAIEKDDRPSTKFVTSTTTSGRIASDNRGNRVSGSTSGSILSQTAPNGGSAAALGTGSGGGPADTTPSTGSSVAASGSLRLLTNTGSGRSPRPASACTSASTGAVLPALSAFLLLQGIETVALRVERHVENARRVAECLRADHRVDWVNYAGFAENPYHALAQKYFGGRACSLLTFGVKGGFEAGKKFYDALRLVKRLVNMGDAKSLACHPASTTHRQMTVDEQRKAGVTPETIRLSIGIEHIDDIVDDLDQALHAACPERRSLLAAG